jgi:hypothetical protein
VKEGAIIATNAIDTDVRHGVNAGGILPAMTREWDFVPGRDEFAQLTNEDLVDLQRGISEEMVRRMSSVVPVLPE